ncbi:MAG: hypothetical protein ACFFDT_30205 [Candidatus Hodarchaeota archaeon]
MLCTLCELNETAQKHHLDPKNKKYPTIWVCSLCGRMIHAFFTNQELSTSYTTLEKLRSHPRVKKYIKWLWKKNPRSVKVRTSRRVKKQQKY